MEKGAAGPQPTGAAMNRTYAVTSINGKAPPAAVGRANAYEISLSDSALSFSLGCGNVAISGSFVDGLFRADDPVNGGVVTGGGPCGIPPDKRLEPTLHRHLMEGRVKVIRSSNSVTLAAPGLVIEGQSR
jgi:hypothetical protein